jgi:hypothetical protein
MSTIPPTEPDDAAPARRYADEAAAQDQFLDRRLAEIRTQYEAGSITVRQAADARVAALEQHLAAVRALRAEHFGEPS